MEQLKLRELLDTLHHELEQVQSVDPEMSTRLQELRADTGRLLNEPDCTPATEQSDSLRERFQEALDHFETDHPKLSMTIQHILDSLARMGF